MWLKKIEIKGFKSFYKKTEIILTRPGRDKGGITAIVGPNGSGKSNICDALKWSLGAQSKKQVRSKKNRDVIFGGSSLKRPLSSAFVSLFFDNRDKKISLSYKEVVVTRKIYASGENEYYINNSRVQLKNILEILGEAGIGQESYSIVNQGLADRLITVSPLTRKEMIEEAARVKHFQTKKQSSIKRLEKAKDNLDKARVIINEIGPRLEYLGIQAEKKKKQKELERELEEKSRKYYGTLWKEIEKKKKQHENAREELEKELAGVEKKLTELKKTSKTQGREERISRKDRFLEKERERELEKELKRAGQKENSLLREVSIAQGQLEILGEKIVFEKTKDERRIDISYVKEKLKKLIQEIDQAKKNRNFIFKGLIRVRGLAIRLKDEISKGVIKIDKTPAIRELEKSLERVEKIIKNRQKEICRAKNEQKLILDRLGKIKEKEDKKRQAFFYFEKDREREDEKKEQIKDRLNLVDIELAKIEVRESDLRMDIKNTLKIEPEEIKGGGLERVNAGKLGQEVAELIKKISVCETIEPGVIKEYEKTSKRYDGFMEKTKDIKETMKSLKKIIRDLEEKIDSRFKKTFQKINKNFSKFFRIIFKGGTARLLKVEIPDKSEEQAGKAGSFLTGIDIKAAPPGKKIKGLGMLSGGEKALTSIAFLFSMIASGAPPFVMLDEVDAALDEVNSARFAKILQIMGAGTQFIVVTHNREVMRQAQILYGVTMGDGGESSLLSLDLEKKD
ncbi:AAA family ATPase [Patescibacteria group bacterium]|nr:AAA family ATPase [Patescibacteria group bacterium]